MSVQISPEMGEALNIINSRPPIITLTGSAKFEKEYHDWNRWLTFAGITVFSLACFPSVMGSKEWYNASQKSMLDNVHMNKIEASKAVLVINKGGYIGESTMREIIFAFGKGKKVFSTELIGDSTGDITHRLHQVRSWADDAPEHIYTVSADDIKHRMGNSNNG